MGALVTRGGIFPLIGLAFLGIATGGLVWSLVGDEDVRLLVARPGGSRAHRDRRRCGGRAGRPARALSGDRPGRPARGGAVPCPRPAGRRGGVPPAAAVPRDRVGRRSRSRTGSSEASVPPPPPFLLALPLAAFVTLASTSFLWTWDERAGGIALAFFVFPFTAGLATVARSPIADWLPRALLATLVALGTLFAAVGIWQAHTRTLFFGRDVEVANAYTSFFRVTSLFKDPSLYGRYLVVPIAVLLVAILVRRGRTLDWVVATGFVAFLFLGLFYSYSQSSFVALFVVTFAVAVVGARPPHADRAPRLRARRDARGRRRRGSGDRGPLREGRHERPLTPRRRHGRGVQGAADRGRRASAVSRARARRSSRRAPRAGTRRTRRRSRSSPSSVSSGSRSTPGCSWPPRGRSSSSPERDRAFGVGLAAVFLVLVVHSLLYAGFFEDPLTWGVIGLACAALARAPVPEDVREPAVRDRAARSGAPGTLTLGRCVRPFASCRKPSPGSSLRSRSPCSPCSVSRSGSR